MATGHVDPGYSRVVSRCRTAINNPSGKRTQPKINNDELEQIRAQARNVWLTKDTSETTYGHYHKEPVNLIQDILTKRPTSPTRKNNPHPNK